jgi:hypothetical protein
VVIWYIFPVFFTKKNLATLLSGALAGANPTITSYNNAQCCKNLRHGK